MLITELPRPLQEEFEHMARSLYDRDGVRQALIEAVELWLTQHRKLLIEAEATANDLTFESLKTELERDYPGKWIVIAHGILQGVGNSIREVGPLAADAQDRIVMQIGQHRPKQVDVGWQIAFS
jgi:hypothetical protein